MSQNYSRRRDLDKLEGHEFEDLIARLLTKMGLQIQEIRRTVDGGIDIVATSEEPIVGGKFIVQCKRSSSNVGEPVVRDLFGALHHYGANKAILVTTAGFTNRAKQFAKDKPIELIDGDKLRYLLNKYNVQEDVENLPNGMFVLFSPGTLRLVRGLTQIASNINRYVRKSRLMAPRRRKISNQKFLSFIEEVTDNCAAISTSLRQIINDIGKQDFFSLDISYADLQLEIIQDLVDSLVKLHSRLRSYNVEKELIRAQQLGISLIETLLLQLATFCQKTSIIEEMHGSVAFEDKRIVLEVDLNISPKLRELKSEIRKLRSQEMIIRMFLKFMK